MAWSDSLFLQDIVAINVAIANHTLASRPVLVDAFTTAKAKNGRLHFLGLVRMMLAIVSMMLLAVPCTPGE